MSGERRWVWRGGGGHVSAGIWSRNLSYSPGRREGHTPDLTVSSLHYQFICTTISSPTSLTTSRNCIRRWQMRDRASDCEQNGQICPAGAGCFFNKVTPVWQPKCADFFLLAPLLKPLVCLTYWSLCMRHQYSNMTCDTFTRGAFDSLHSSPTI